MGRKRKSSMKKSMAMKEKYKKVSEVLVPCEDQVKTPSDRKLNRRLTDLESSSLEVKSTIGSEEYVLMKLECLKLLIAVCRCPDCSNISLTVELGKNFGYAQDIKLRCTTCEFYTEVNSSSKEKGKEYDVNRRAVHAFVELGKGHAAAQLFSSFMNSNFTLY